MKIAVIIVTYNAIRWLNSCLSEINSATKDTAVIIIDNGSIDGTQKIIHDKYPHFIFYQSNENLGFGKANNLGIGIALKLDCTHFLLLNQDAKISWSNIVLLQQILDLNPTFGLISPLQKYSESAVDKLHLQSILNSNTPFLNDIISGNKIKELYEIKYTNAAIWMISKKCLELVGGFDPLFQHYGEDTEYAQRVNSLELKIGLCPSIIGFHFRTQDSIRPRTKDYFFNLFLVQAKDRRTELWKTYLNIFIRIILSPLRNSTTSKELKNNAALKAFVKLLRLRRSLIQNRTILNKQSYCFLNYK